MKMEEFLEKLGRALNRMSPATRQEILADYEEHFRSGREHGRTDEDICNKLGNPYEIARSYAAEQYAAKAQKATSLGDKFAASVRALLATFGLGFFNLVFIVGPYFGLMAIVFAFWIASFAVAASGATIAFMSLFLPNNLSFNWWQMEQCMGSLRVVAGFGGLGTVCLGLLLALGMGFLTKLFIKATLWYVRLNIKIAINKGELQ